MNNRELIDRYIYAVISYLPQKDQADVERELDSVISDMLEARSGDPDLGDVKAVLKELGNPAELAEKYSGAEGKALLSGIYYLWFVRLSKIVIPIVASCIAVISVITQFAALPMPNASIQYTSDVFTAVFSGLIGGGLEGALQGFLWVLLVCFVLEQKHINFYGENFTDRLSAVPPRRARIKFHEPVINICWSILAAVLLLAFPYAIGAYTSGTGWVAAFNIGVIRSSWPLVVVLAALGIGKEAYKLYERCYSIRLAIVSALANALTAICAGVLLLSRNIVNPAFVEAFRIIFEKDGEAAASLAANANIALFGIVVFALVVDTATTMYRSLRYRP